MSVQTDALAKLAEIPPVGSEELERLSAAATAGTWHLDMFPYRDVETGEEEPPRCEGICTHDDDDGLADSIATCGERDARFIVALVNAWRSGKLSAPGLAAASGSGGWRTVDDCPSDGRQVWVFGGRHKKPALRAADGSWWRHEAKSPDFAHTVPTHWMPEFTPDPPALAGEAAQAAETEGLGSRASDGEAGTPEQSPPDPPPAVLREPGNGGEV